MSTVPPNSNDPDEAPDATPETSAVPPTAPPAPMQDPSAGQHATPAAPDAGAPETTGPGTASPAAPGAPDPAADRPGADPVDDAEYRRAAGVPAEQGTAAPAGHGAPAEQEAEVPAEEGADVPTAPAAPAEQGAGAEAPPAEETTRMSTAPATGEPATRQLPTEEEDEALRTERARRFGRVASSGSEPVDADQQDRSDTAVAGTAAGAGAGAGLGAGAGAGSAGATETDRTTTLPADGTHAPATDEDDPFRDFDEGPRSRAAAHWWGILIALVFGPVTWYLVADGGERISYALSQNLESINVMGLVELGGGLLTLIIMLMAARWSSVGSIIIGSIGTLIGAAFLVVPQIVADFLSSQSMIFDRLGQFGTNIFDHLVSDGHSGRLLLYGITFIFVGVVSHGARRQGRREERRKATLGL